MALAQTPADRDLPALVSATLSTRAGLAGPELDAASRLARYLDYDRLLVRLCDDLGVPQTITAGGPVEPARRDVEIRLAARLPDLRPLLGARHGSRPE